MLKISKIMKLKSNIYSLISLMLIFVPFLSAIRCLWLGASNALPGVNLHSIENGSHNVLVSLETSLFINKYKLYYFLILVFYQYWNVFAENGKTCSTAWLPESSEFVRRWLPYLLNVNDLLFSINTFDEDWCSIIDERNLFNNSFGVLADIFPYFIS